MDDVFCHVNVFYVFKSEVCEYLVVFFKKNLICGLVSLDKLFYPNIMIFRVCHFILVFFTRTKIGYILCGARVGINIISFIFFDCFFDTFNMRSCYISKNR